MGSLGVFTALLGLWTVTAHAITLHVTDDTFIQKEAPTASSGAAGSLSINNKNLTKEHITYALFDLALLPLHVTLDKAVLRFFVNQVGQPGTIKIYVVTGGAWAEQTLTWNNAPASVAAVPTIITSIFAADAGSYVTVDITQIVQDWVNGLRPNLGLAIRGDSPALNIALDSKENASTSHPMEREVAFAGGVAGPAGAARHTGASRTSGTARGDGRPGAPGGARAAGTTGPAGAPGRTRDAGTAGPVVAGGFSEHSHLPGARGHTVWRWGELYLRPGDMQCA